jgi:hypothetical protein
MAGMRKRTLVAVTAVAAAAGAVAATVAGGQAAGPPTGTLSFKVIFKEEGQSNRSGINPAVPRDKKRPKVADLAAGNVDVLSPEGQKIGRAHNFDVTTFEGAKKYKGGAVTEGFPVVDFGGGNLLFAACIREDAPTNNHCAIIGGTGRFSGARGTAVEDFEHGVEDKKAKTFTLPVNVTFMP